MDRNGDGGLDESELKKLLKKGKPDMTDKQVHISVVVLFKARDIGHHGELQPRAGSSCGHFAKRRAPASGWVVSAMLCRTIVQEALSQWQTRWDELKSGRLEAILQAREKEARAIAAFESHKEHSHSLRSSFVWCDTCECPVREFKDEYHARRQQEEQAGLPRELTKKEKADDLARRLQLLDKFNVGDQVVVAAGCRLQKSGVIIGPPSSEYHVSAEQGTRATVKSTDRQTGNLRVEIPKKDCIMHFFWPRQFADRIAFTASVDELELCDATTVSETAKDSIVVENAVESPASVDKVDPCDETTVSETVKDSVVAENVVESHDGLNDGSTIVGDGSTTVGDVALEEINYCSVQ
eukprot:TRINITY_DN13915_c0_g2_i1.p1 TRINITY_DN13915_c0_g2~~TRINITY_DN13915_c0_g2_i1.p1  ORF type:complete len:364 (+),score=71.87 TRINITY_DN13915_c0_g2_i1:36-1094(+)